jgi:hypothetical protein
MPPHRNISGKADMPVRLTCRFCQFRSRIQHESSARLWSELCRGARKPVSKKAFV